MSGHKWFAAFCERMAASAEKGHMKDVRREVAGGASGSVLEVGSLYPAQMRLPRAR